MEGQQEERPMDDNKIYDTIDEFAAIVSAKWEIELDTPNAPSNITELLYTLALDLADELAIEQIAALPITSVRTFLLAGAKGITPEALVYCYLTSPTDSASFATLKSVYEPAKSTPAPANQKVLH
jgi:hypothetical protein